ncbi:MAG: Type 1 glutamine amidotransferase-like domain-containing protein [Desulfofustis sp. PB-SRB1]|jgi:cyanophycinase|nr:Type 1 glutamine amidotransferase-like domain-containing protein [Desulfofustis sp. PB-SRB1]MBM1002658.1 Type 1 glutamine amidotransferase-like domain-containing protein [Desulfofustis sp. PB-SRB1]HBH29971.1 hypothetical protein [Desulfofustis sp.]
MSRGCVLLAGGAEFGGAMAAADERAVLLAGGAEARVVIIVAAAAPDNNHERAGARAVAWFKSVGAKEVRCSPVIDQSSANDERLATGVAEGTLIYLLGGFPGYLLDVLQKSLVWRAILAAWSGGAVIGGSSAGAMVLCEHLFDPRTDSVRPGLALVAGTCFIPHLNTFGNRWRAPLRKALPNTTLLGVDEETALINDGDTGDWRVYGGGGVLLEDESGLITASSGETIPAAWLRVNLGHG